MKFWNGIFDKKDDNFFHYRLILDIGTEYLKAAIVEYNRDEQSIISISMIIQDSCNTD